MPHKRSREEGEDGASSRPAKVSDVKSSARAIVGEVSGISVPDSASFQVYSKGKTGPYVIHGESDKMSYSGAQDETSSQYCLAIYNKEENSVQLVPAPLVRVDSMVKSKMAYNGPRIRQEANQTQYSAQRAALGEAFGTRKAKQAIRNQQRNKIESDQLADLESAIVGTVKTSTSNLPSQQSRTENLEAERPIPPCNLETADVYEVYPIVGGLLSEREWNSIRVSDIMQESDADARFALLPKTNSDYIRTRLDVIFDSGSGSEKEDRIKLLYYAALLLGLYKNRRASTKTKLMEALGNPPEHLVFKLIENFTTSKTGNVGKSKDRAFIVDPAHETKLLCYFLVAALHIEDFSCNVQKFVNELSIKGSKVAGLFRNLGCSVRPMSATRMKELGLTDASAKEAILKAPLVLPQMTRRIRSKN